MRHRRITARPADHGAFTRSLRLGWRVLIHIDSYRNNRDIRIESSRIGRQFFIPHQHMSAQLADGLSLVYELQKPKALIARRVHRRRQIDGITKIQNHGPFLRDDAFEKSRTDARNLLEYEHGVVVTDMPKECDAA